MSQPEVTASDSATVRRSVVASTVGAAIEWFDYMLYGAAAALVFPALFFPEADPYVGVLLAFSTFFVGFLARPIGAAIFGHIGDRVGRKKALLATIVLMGIGTLGVGLMPTYASIGVWAPILLALLRCLQGFGVGGEWGGAVLLATESGSSRSRGFRASFPQASALIGIGGANLAFVLAAASMSHEAFMSWGWRLPFLSSVALVVVGLWIRQRVPETDDFRRLQASGKVSRAPLTEVLRSHPKQILLCTLLKSAEMVPVYIFITFILSYGTEQLSYSRTSLLLLVSFSALLGAAAVVVAGRYSDRIGHERVYVIGAGATFVFGFVYFAMIDTGSTLLAAIAIVVSLLSYALMFSAEAVIITKNFAPQVRYSGSSLSFNLAGIIGGGPAPLIATYLFHEFGSTAIALYIALGCVLGLVALRWLVRLRPRPAVAPPALAAASEGSA
jgi:MFS family permease